VYNILEANESLVKADACLSGTRTSRLIVTTGPMFGKCMVAQVYVSLLLVPRRIYRRGFRDLEFGVIFALGY